jgi:hypothetical protein
MNSAELPLTAAMMDGIRGLTIAPPGTPPATEAAAELRPLIDRIDKNLLAKSKEIRNLCRRHV